MTNRRWKSIIIGLVVAYELIHYRGNEHIKKYVNVGNLCKNNSHSQQPASNHVNTLAFMDIYFSINSSIYQTNRLNLNSKINKISTFADYEKKQTSFIIISWILFRPENRINNQT